MDSQRARDVVISLQDDIGDNSLGTSWKDKCHVATDTFTEEVIEELNNEDNGIALVEIFLNKELPRIDMFCDLVNVTDAGIWYCDNDGGLSVSIWRQYLIPWHCVDCVVLHQVS